MCIKQTQTDTNEFKMNTNEFKMNTNTSGLYTEAQKFVAAV